jgi:hypothetical protein
MTNPDEKTTEQSSTAPPATPPTSPEQPKPTENTTAPETHDEEDIPKLLARHTFDGKGDAAVPPSDFQSFATEGVEKKLKSTEDVAQEVLNGNWGHNAQTVSQRLHEAGYDVLEVEKEYNRRKAAGAPSSLMQ